MQNPHAKEHPITRAQRRACREQARLRKGINKLYPCAKPAYPPNHSGIRRASRAALAVTRRRSVVNA